MSAVVDAALFAAFWLALLATVSLLTARKGANSASLAKRGLAIGVGLAPLWLSLVVLTSFILFLRNDGAMTLIDMSLSVTAFFTVLITGYLVWGALVRRGGVLARLEAIASQIRADNLGEA